MNALYNDELSHVTDNALRGALAKTMYGTRWLYKLGLSLLVDGDESIAHVRTQVIDYSSICEALLGDCILYGFNRNIFVGTAYQTVNNLRAGARINWNTGNKAIKLKNRTFYWLIEVAGDEGIVTSHLKRSLTQLRHLRNTVHITNLAANNRSYYRTLAKLSFTTVYNMIAATKAWKQAHP